MTKKVFVVLIVLITLLASTSTVLAGPPPPDKPDCTKIQDGVIMYSVGHYLQGQPLTTGYDPFGYNYQAQAWFSDKGSRTGCI